MIFTSYANDFESTTLVGDPVRLGLRARDADQDWLARLKIRLQTSLVSASILTVEYPVVGIDVSSWQGIMDWGIARAKIHFAFLRAGVGNDVPDPQYSRNRLECINRDIAYSPYWYLKPDKNWRTTAESFAARYLETDGHLPAWADLETTGGLGKSELESWLKKFDARFYELTGTFPGYYTSAGFLNVSLALTNWLKLRMLWVAHWTGAPYPILPREWSVPGKPWWFWQWSANGNGKGAEYGAQSHSIDLNRFRLSYAEFNSMFAENIGPLPGDIPPPPPSGENVMEWYVKATTTPHLNVRATPNGVDVGNIYPNEHFFVKNMVYAASGVWAQISAGQWVDKWVCLHDYRRRWCEPA